MSENSSLYLKLEISEAKLQQFFEADPIPVILDRNWQSWWDSREMYNKEPLTHIPYYRFATNRAVFDELMEDKSFLSTEHYDNTTQCWTFISVFFSENYWEILPMLSLLQNMMSYQDPNNKGAAIIYSYYWGATSVMAYLTLTENQFRLHHSHNTDEIPPEFLTEANRDLDHAVEKLSQQFED
ncbi:hypothetical protein [Sphingobacterium corticibacter]|uniref:Uncharacterized protein n=1 Tax=Sphingobacterium corticibacter TaxID=2171749 RepID=A0A2T8HER9_9SPHI|nr:hypothetical protein [Sphingobacterium corticibacter]PVH23904.1 hypothetical protein DC487_16880 [Sphingobacterium corticibacter]